MSWLAKALGGGGGGGGAAKPSKPSIDTSSLAAMEKINQRIELLDKKLDYLEKQAREQQMMAKKIGTKTEMNKRKALMHMKRYKQLQEQARLVEGQRDNLDNQRSALEMAQISRGTVEVMGEVQNVINHSIDIDVAEDTMDDVIEGMDRVKEVTEAMARPMGDQYDQSELEDELADFLAEDMAEELSELPDPVKAPEPALGEDMPEPATHKLTDEQKDEEALLSWAS